MSRFIKSIEETNSNNDDLHSITNVKEIDVQAVHLSYLDQFKNLSLSFYNEPPIHYSQTSTNFTNKSNYSKEDKINSFDKTKQIMCKIFKNAMKKPLQDNKISNNNIKQKTGLNKPKTSLNFKTFYLNNRFTGALNLMKSNNNKQKDLSLNNNSKIACKSYVSIINKKKPDFQQNCVNNVRISLKENQPKKSLNSSFTARSLSKNSKKNELNNSFSSNLKNSKAKKEKNPLVLNKKVVLEQKPLQKPRKSLKNDEKMVRSFRK